MPLSPGIRLGPYEILGALGAGGMGEVYRARDTRLGREVAIKILPAHLSSDPLRKLRFEREAKTICSLNHPHICVLHDVGSQDGIDYLVMECVEGETLARRLEKGALPVEQVLKYGMQITDALDKAHRSGVIHRDLKPGNIMLTPTGAKLLDFGLAKPTTPMASLATLTATAAKQSPATEQGTIVGTFQYMSPEQIEAKELDGRSDIFSLGAVLYEMVTGQRAFQGKSQLSVASAILEKEPEPISTIRPTTPPALDHAVRRCLAKDREERWQTTRDLVHELKWIAEGGSQAAAAVLVTSSRKLLERLAWTAGALGIALTLILWQPWRSAPGPPQPIHVTAEIGAEAGLPTDLAPVVALSPNGSHLGFIAQGADHKDRIYIRSLEQLRAAPLSGTEGAEDLFFSPDGQWIGFFAEGKLKKISTEGGAAVTLCDAPVPRGGSWSEDGTIMFSPRAEGGLSRVSSSGGTPQLLTALDKQAREHTHRWPQVLPGGRVVMFTSSARAGVYEDADIEVYSISSDQRKKVYRGGFHGRYLPSGHLIYMHEGTLFGAPFDLKRLEVTGPAAPIVEGVATNSGLGSAAFSFSRTGTLVYVGGASYSLNVSIDWMDSEGKFQPLRETPGSYRTPAFSPDGKRLALAIREAGRTDIWVYDWARDALTRLTFAGQDNMYPVWTPDGRRVTYASSEKSGPSNIYWKHADGSGDAQRLTAGGTTQHPYTWSPDGKVLAFSEFSLDNSFDIMTLSVEGDEKSGWKFAQPKPFLNSPFDEGTPAFSPDGRWLAYNSNESGSGEVYVRPFPGPGGKWQVSTGGGVLPKWSRNGKELFYRTLQDNRIMVANYTTSGDSFRADKPRLWSPGQFTSAPDSLDLHPDGKRFAVLKPPGAESQTVVNKVSFIFNFFEELRRKAATGKD